MLVPRKRGNALIAPNGWWPHRPSWRTESLSFLLALLSRIGCCRKPSACNL